MSFSPTLSKYLAAENIKYDEIPHELTMTSSRTAEACHVSGDRLAKAIVLRATAATYSRSYQHRTASGCQN